jgi:hypothetical protein
MSFKTHDSVNKEVKRLRSFDEWIMSDEGRECLRLPTSEEYLKSRLLRAYFAGLNSNELQKTIDWYEVKQREMKEEIKKLKE